jgi:RHS repeat-associated protein
MTNSADTGTGQSLTLIYDAEGQRAQKWIAGGTIIFYLHDAFGQLAAEYNRDGVTPSCTTCYLTYDMLGSPRMITDQNQNLVARHDYIPFGEEIMNGTAGRNGNFGYSSGVTQGFTGQESDGGTASLDFFQARHLSGVLGRFVQPDPGHAGAKIANPQSWNGYGYVANNPLAFTDSTGMFCDEQCGGGGGGGLPNIYEFDFMNIPVTIQSYVPGQAPQPTYLEFPSGITSATITFGTPPGSWQSVQVGTLGDYDVPVGLDIWQGQQKLWSNTAIVGNALGAATAAVSALPAVVPAVSSAASVAGTAANRALLGPLTNRVFWSGSGAMLGAMRWAAGNEGTALEMTPVGRALELFGDFASSLWPVASRFFAQGATGPVVVYQGSVLRVGSIWGSIEYPILSSGGNPITYIGH